MGIINNTFMLAHVAANSYFRYERFSLMENFDKIT